MKKHISYRWFVVCVLVLGLSLVVVGCSSSDTESSGNSEGQESEANGDMASDEAIDLRVATNNTKTSWYAFTSALRQVLKDSSPAINLDVLPISGGTGNAQLIAQDEADFGLLFNVTSKWAYEGIVAYEDKYEDLRGLVGGLNQYYVGIIARTDFLEKNNIDSIADIKEQEIPVRVITNPVGTLAEYSTRLTLDSYGLDYDMIEEFGGSVELTSNDVIMSSFQNGKADLHVLAMTKAHPVITEIALKTDITVMEMEDNITTWFKDYGFKGTTFPAGEFEGQDYDVNTAGFVSTYVTDKEMDEDVAYMITKAVNENKEALVKGHSSVEDFDLNKAAEENLMGVPLHPGAKRYYEEAGILK